MSGTRSTRRRVQRRTRPTRPIQSKTGGPPSSISDSRQVSLAVGEKDLPERILKGHRNPNKDGWATGRCFRQPAGLTRRWREGPAGTHSQRSSQSNQKRVGHRAVFQTAGRSHPPLARRTCRNAYPKVIAIPHGTGGPPGNSARDRRAISAPRDQRACETGKREGKRGAREARFGIFLALTGVRG
jgi:hypothetical protein